MNKDPQKFALVTGAAKRIGRVIALALAREGWDIVVHYRHSREDAERLVADIRGTGRHAVAVQCDLADADQTSTLIQRAALAINGTITCLVNNASLFEEDDAATFTRSMLDAHMHVNLAAPVMLATGLHAALPAGTRGVVINLLDQKLFNLNPDFLSYTLSKAALQTATVMLAQQLAPQLRVVGIAPGITMVSGDQTEEGFAKAHTVTPLGRSSTPEDIAATVCFVAQAPAITGTTLIVDGGQHLIPLQRDVMFLAK